MCRCAVFLCLEDTGPYKSKAKRQIRFKLLIEVRSASLCASFELHLSSPALSRLDLGWNEGRGARSVVCSSLADWRFLAVIFARPVRLRHNGPQSAGRAHFGSGRRARDSPGRITEISVLVSRFRSLHHNTNDFCLLPTKQSAPIAYCRAHPQHPKGTADGTIALYHP